MTTPSKQSILQIAQGNVQPGQFEGVVVWWGLTDANVPDADFRSRWVAAGLPEAAIPRERSAHRNLTDAAKAAMIGVDGYLVRPITRAGVFGDVTKLAIVKEERDPTHDVVRHTQESAITLTTAPHPNDATVTVKTFAVSTSHPIADRVRAEWEKLEGSLTAAEIRRAIVNMMGETCAVILREHGGVYWVPNVNASTIDALRDVINATGKSQFDVLPLFATGIGTQTIAAAASKSVADEVVRLQAEIEAFKAEAPRSGVLARRLVEYDALRTRAKLYRDVLSMDVTSLEQAIDDLSASVDILLSPPPAPLLSDAAQAPAPGAV